MPIQDDERENEQIKLFGLTKPVKENRSGVDAFLFLKDGKQIPFELKSTTNGSVTTVRDFGYDHIQKWKDKHWLISKYSTDGKQIEYSLYGSPKAMSKWIQEKKAYIKADFELAKLLPEKLTLNDLYSIMGKQVVYSLDDAKKLHKKQFKISEYRERMDLENGYSPKRMLEILKNRCNYIIERGSTLNNPHIPKSYFKGWEQITSNHKKRLRVLVHQALKI